MWISVFKWKEAQFSYLCWAQLFSLCPSGRIKRQNFLASLWAERREWYQEDPDHWKNRRWGQRKVRRKLEALCWQLNMNLFFLPAFCCFVGLVFFFFNPPQTPMEGWKKMAFVLPFLLPLRARWPVWLCGWARWVAFTNLMPRGAQKWQSSRKSSGTERDGGRCRTKESPEDKLLSMSPACLPCLIKCDCSLQFLSELFMP